jgi:DNA-binding beta-propeller fold protein YncE
MRRTTIWGSALAASALATTALVGAPAAGAHRAHSDPPTLRVLASGFGLPTHVAFGPGHSLYVADAAAGTITRLGSKHWPAKVVASLGEFTPGLDVRGGKIYVAASASAGPTEQGPTHLYKIGRHGQAWPKADLLAWELANNPDGQSLDAPDAQSNPYSVLALPGRVLVADAGANDIIEVRANGKMRTLVALPLITDGACAGAPNNDPEHAGCDPVPTDLELGPDGYLYVSGLGAEVEGHIYKINPWSGKIVRTWSDLPPLTGIAVSPYGAIYAASLFTDTVFRIRGGSVTTATVPGPLDVEWGRHGLVASSATGNVYAVPKGLFS